MDMEMHCRPPNTSRCQNTPPFLKNLCESVNKT
jgi:hypothetical protein